MGHCDILGKQEVFVHNIILNISPLSELVLLPAVKSHLGVLMRRLRGKRTGADNLFFQIESKHFLKLLLEAFKCKFSTHDI